MDLKETLCGRIMEKDYANLSDDIMNVVGKKISNKILERKESIINKLNGITESKKEKEDSKETDETGSEEYKKIKKEKEMDVECTDPLKTKKKKDFKDIEGAGDKKKKIFAGFVEKI